MSLLDKFFSSKENESFISENPNIKIVYEFDSYVNTLLESDSYIAKSEYLKRQEECKDAISYFKQLKADGLLNDLCKKNKIPADAIIAAVDRYDDVKNLVEEHNKNFISTKLESEKDYLDSILKDCDPNILLDEDQRKVVLTDEDYCLVIAGAGAGKTTTVAAKVKYLVEKQHINPPDILVVSFTNKAVGELKD